MNGETDERLTAVDRENILARSISFTRKMAILFRAAWSNEHETE
jgi:hypothetical protein